MTTSLVISITLVALGLGIIIFSAIGLRSRSEPLATRILITIIGGTLNDTVDVGKTYLATATPVDATGTTRSVFPGSYSWTISDPTFATLTPTLGGGNTATLVILAAGTATLTASANADPLGMNHVPISGTDVLTGVIPPAPQATTINITLTAL